MKVEWITYGPGPGAEEGWHVLGKSSGVKQKDEKWFLELCGAVPLPGAQEGLEKVYFGEGRSGRCFLCQGVYAGKERSGREGAWVFDGFIVPSALGRNCPCRLTRWIGEQRPTGGSTEPIDMDEPDWRASSAGSENLAELLNERRRLLLAVPEGYLDDACNTVDALIAGSLDKFPSYVLPAAKETRSFDVVGLSPDDAPGDGAVVPLAVADPARRWWKRAVVALAVVALLASAFGVWGCAAVQSSRRQREQGQQQLRQIESRVAGLHEKAATIRYMLTEQGAEFGQILSSEPRKVESFSVKIGVTTYTFTRRDASELVRTLSDLLDDVDALRQAVEHGDPANREVRQ